jgi:hypothetical protein
MYFAFFAHTAVIHSILNPIRRVLKVVRYYAGAGPE